MNQLNFVTLRAMLSPNISTIARKAVLGSGTDAERPLPAPRL